MQALPRAGAAVTDGAGPGGIVGHVKMWPPEGPVSRRYPGSDGLPCAYCGQTMRYGSDPRLFPSLDHKISRHRGGTDVPENVVMCCSRCNLVKGVMSPAELAEFRSLLGDRADHFFNVLYVSARGWAGRRRAGP